MSNGAGRPPYEVTSAYERFVEAFRLAVENANGVVALSSSGVLNSFHAAGAANAEFRLSLWLKQCPHRRLGNKRLDVVIRALEKLQGPSWDLIQSTVYANYFVVSNSTARLVQSLHYDFVAGGQECHPLFHVQLTDEPIDAAGVRDINLDLEVKLPDEPNMCWVTTRIPTPDMTLASVLYCMVADHLGPGIFREFESRVLSIQDKLPRLGYAALKNSVDSSLHFKSSHWFAHMVKPPAKQA